MRKVRAVMVKGQHYRSINAAADAERVGWQTIVRRCEDPNNKDYEYYDDYLKRMQIHKEITEAAEQRQAQALLGSNDSGDSAESAPNKVPVSSLVEGDYIDINRHYHGVSHPVRDIARFLQLENDMMLFQVKEGDTEVAHIENKHGLITKFSRGFGDRYFSDNKPNELHPLAKGDSSK